MRNREMITAQVICDFVTSHRSVSPDVYHEKGLRNQRLHVSYVMSLRCSRTMTSAHLDTYQLSVHTIYLSVFHILATSQYPDSCISSCLTKRGLYKAISNSKLKSNSQCTGGCWTPDETLMSLYSPHNMQDDTSDIVTWTISLERSTFC